MKKLEIVDLVESYHFYIKIIFIRDRMKNINLNGAIIILRV
jgi:hypothetical protein